MQHRTDGREGRRVNFADHLLSRRELKSASLGMLLERPRSMSQFPVLAPPEGLESSEHEEHELELPLSLEMSCQTSESVVVQSASGVVLANHSRIVDEYSTFQMVLESISHSVHEVETAACDADAETAIAPSDDTQASAVVASDDTAAGESGDAAGLVQATATNSASSSSSATKWDSRLDSLVEGRDYKVARRTDKAVDLLFASVPKMLSVLAYEQVPDMEDIDMILWTYHRHVKAKELLSFLNLRFLLPTPPDASDDLKAFYNQCRVPVRMRVVNVCKRWIEARYLDFKNDPDLLSALVSFRDETVAGDARVGRRCVPTLTNAMMTAQAATAEPLHRDRSAVEYHYESIDGLVSLMMHPLRGVPLFQKKHMFRTFRNCFYGDEAIRWLAASMLHLDRPRERPARSFRMLSEEEESETSENNASERNWEEDSISSVSSDNTDDAEDHGATTTVTVTTTATTTVAASPHIIGSNVATLPSCSFAASSAIQSSLSLSSPMASSVPAPSISPPASPRREPEPLLLDVDNIKLRSLSALTEDKTRSFTAPAPVSSSLMTPIGSSPLTAAAATSKKLMKRKSTAPRRVESEPPSSTADSASSSTAMSPLTRDSRVFLIFSELLEKKVIQEVSVGLSKASGSFKPNSIYSFSDAMDKSRSVLDFPALDIALYLTTTEFPRFKQISFLEFERKIKGQPSVALNTFADRSTKLSLWVGTELIRASSHKQRILVMQRFISIADELLKLRNFEFTLAVLSGLKSVKIMSELWKGLKSKFLESYDALLALFSSKNNFAAYRQYPKDAPMIPYIGLLLQDLTFIEDGNKDDTTTSPLDPDIRWVNMRKMKLLASVYSFISRAQTSAYETYSPLPMLRFFVTERMLDVLTEHEIRKKARELRNAKET